MIRKAKKVIAVIYRIVVSLIFIFVLYKSYRKNIEKGESCGYEG